MVMVTMTPVMVMVMVMVVVMVMVMVVVMEDCMRYSNTVKRLDQMMMLMVEVIMVMIVTTILEQLITLQAILLLKTSKLWPSIMCLANVIRLHDVVHLDSHHNKQQSSLPPSPVPWCSTFHPQDCSPAYPLLDLHP